MGLPVHAGAPPLVRIIPRKQTQPWVHANDGALAFRPHQTGDKSMSETNSMSIGARVKMLRENRDMELEHLAEETGQSQEYLQKLENDEFRPPVAVLLGLARALKVDSVLLLQEPEDREAGQHHVETVQKRTENYAYEALAPNHMQKYLKSFMVTIEPGTKLDGPGYQHKGEEFHYVLKGEVLIEVEGSQHLLKQNDSFYFDSSKVHKLSNPGTERTEVLVVLYTP